MSIFLASQGRAYATPATYEVDGRQYVVNAAGAGRMNTKSGDAYVVLHFRNGGSPGAYWRAVDKLRISALRSAPITATYC